MADLKNLWSSTELKQFKQKLQWLCNFTTANFNIYYDNKKKKQMDVALTAKMAGLFSTLKALDLGIYIAERENLNKEDITLMTSLKEFLELSIGFDGYENDIIISNIRELIETILIPLCNIKEEKQFEDVFAWGKEMKISNRGVKEQTVSVKQKQSNPPIPPQPIQSVEPVIQSVHAEQVQTQSQQQVQSQYQQPIQQNQIGTPMYHGNAQMQPEGDFVPEMQRPQSQPNNYLNARFAQADKEEGAPIQIPPPGNVRQQK